jgi:hypothetical protein
MLCWVLDKCDTIVSDLWILNVVPFVLDMCDTIVSDFVDFECLVAYRCTFVERYPTYTFALGVCLFLVSLCSALRSMAVHVYY